MVRDLKAFISCSHQVSILSTTTSRLSRAAVDWDGCVALTAWRGAFLGLELALAHALLKVSDKMINGRGLVADRN